MTESVDQAAIELAERQRCGICGHFHPLVRVCPYVRRTQTTIEGVSRGGKPWRRHTEVEYFPRPEIAAQSMRSLDDEDA